MDIFNALILGVLQGITEFLPISSSGHLAVSGNLLEFNQPGILFEAILHAGTAASIIWYMRNKIFDISLDVWKSVAVASIPVGIIGLFFSLQIEELFALEKLVGFGFLISAYLNFRTDKYDGKKAKPDMFDAIVIGLFQALAIIPGITRSGSTIFAASKMNLSKEKSAELSFLMSLPVIIGANLVEFVRHGTDSNFSVSLSIVGFIAAFASGLFAIHFLIRILTTRNFKKFSYYLVIIGIATILFL